MTYCVGIKLNDGLVMLSDTRTNAGVDNIARFGKMFTWEQKQDKERGAPDNRAVTVMTSGNLSITQGVITRLNKAIDKSKTDPECESILNCASLYRAAEIVGDAMRELQNHYRSGQLQQTSLYDATLLLAGQREGGGLRLFMIYTEGNFVEATEDTPFFQIGEHKYGKPILDRVISSETPIQKALQAAFVSMDSTVRSNLSVGMPLDMAVIRTGENAFATRRRIEADDQEFQAISEKWSGALRESFALLPDVTL